MHLRSWQFDRFLSSELMSLLIRELNLISYTLSDYGIATPDSILLHPLLLLLWSLLVVRHSFSYWHHRQVRPWCHFVLELPVESSSILVVLAWWTEFVAFYFHSLIPIGHLIGDVPEWCSIATSDDIVVNHSRCHWPVIDIWSYWYFPLLEWIVLLLSLFLLVIIALLL